MRRGGTSRRAFLPDAATILVQESCGGAAQSSLVGPGLSAEGRGCYRVPTRRGRLIDVASRVGLASLVTAAGFVAACATPGRNWVQEPEPGFSQASAAEAARELSASEPYQREPVSERSEDDVVARPRLDRVISLGEGVGSSPVPAPAAAPVGPAPVVVNIVNYAGAGSVPVGGYPLYYGTSARYSSASAGHYPSAPAVHDRSGSSTPALGGDWRAPVSHGPSFPYHSGPASPWERSH
jgi:hypothetical protein